MENAPIARLWLACGTQWNVSFGGATGLHYPSVYLVAGSLGVNMTSGALRRLQMLEGLALEYWRKEREKREKRGKRRA